MYNTLGGSINRTGKKKSDFPPGTKHFQGLDVTVETRDVEYLGYSIEAFPNLRDGKTAIGGWGERGAREKAVEVVPALRKALMDVR